MRTLSTLLLLGTLAACSGADGSASPDADLADALPRQVVSEIKQLQVGELAEATLTGGSGDTATILLAAPVAKLDWNLHGHANVDFRALPTIGTPPHSGDKTIHEEFDVMNVDYIFSPSSRSDWRLIIRNKDTSSMDVAVNIGLYGDMQWNGWQ